MPADSAQDLSKKGLVDADVLQKEALACEGDLTALKVAYEQYFLGLERRPPTAQYEAFKKRIAQLKATFTKSTSTKFRINSVHQKFVTYERLWQRTLKEIEDGTYSRDLFKAKMHARGKSHAAGNAEARKGGKDDDFDIEEDLGDMGLDDALAAASAAVPAPAKPAPAAAPPKTTSAPQMKAVTPPAAAPKAAPPPQAAKPAAPPPAKPAGDVSDAKVKAIYDAYVTAKKRCGEDTSKVTLDSIAQTVRKQVPEIMKQHNAKGVDFKVVIKDGKALLRAVPKE